jgi:hypothetical protein
MHVPYNLRTMLTIFAQFYIECRRGEGCAVLIDEVVPRLTAWSYTSIPIRLHAVYRKNLHLCSVTPTDVGTDEGYANLSNVKRQHYGCVQMFPSPSSFVASTN